MPFLRNVVRGRNVPEARLLEVAHHYERFAGKSPINDQNRALIAALRQALVLAGIGLPVYWGNRNWHPFLADTLRKMKADGVQRALAFVTSAYSSYSGCRQYQDDISRARAEVEGAPDVEKLRVFFNHPDFVAANVERTREALQRLPEAQRTGAVLAFTAHSIPMSMATVCRYAEQLKETCRLVAESVGISEWSLVYQSRSGPPTQPWLEPDILDHLRSLHASGRDVVAVVPLGFVSDHVEVLYDLDVEALDLAASLNMSLVRAQTVGTHPRFVAMIVDLVRERLDRSRVPQAIGRLPAWPHGCDEGCCPSGARPQPSAAAAGEQ